MKYSNAHNGSTFDSFLEQEGIREEVEAVASPGQRISPPHSNTFQEYSNTPK
jgi:hypothetical protein